LPQAGASTAVSVGYYLSMSHFLFNGHTAAVAPKPPVVRSAIHTFNIVYPEKQSF